jgi:hypothetical protein
MEKVKSFLFIIVAFLFLLWLCITHVWGIFVFLNLIGISPCICAGG